jgi:hypothetical protein
MSAAPQFVALPRAPVRPRPAHGARLAAPHSPALWLGSLGLAVLALSSRASALERDSEILLWIVLSTAALLLAPLRRRPEAGEFPDPVWFLALLHVLYFPGRLLFLWWARPYTAVALGAETPVEAEALHALRLVTLAGCAIFWGSGLPAVPLWRLRALRSLRMGRARREDVWAWLVLGYFGAAWRIATAQSMWIWEINHRTSYGPVFLYLTECGLAASAAAAVFARDNLQRALGAALLAANFSALLAYAFKEPILMLILFLLAAWSVRGRRISWSKTGAAGLAAVFLVFPLIHALRAAELRGERAGWNEVARYYRFRASGIENSTAAEAALTALGRFSQRFHGLETVSWILYRVPEAIPHSGLPRFLSRLAWTAVPRAVSPDKPQIHQGPTFNREFLGTQTETPIAMFQLGEAYYVGGPPLLAAVALFLGWFARQISHLRAAFRSERFLPYLCILFWAAVAVERDIVLTWTTYPRVLAVLAISSWALRKLFTAAAHPMPRRTP